MGSPRRDAAQCCLGHGCCPVREASARGCTERVRTSESRGCVGSLGLSLTVTVPSLENKWAVTLLLTGVIEIPKVLIADFYFSFKKQNVAL